MKCLMAGFVVTRHTCEKRALPHLSVRALLRPVDLRFLLIWERIPRGTYRYEVDLFIRPHTCGVWASEGPLQKERECESVRECKRRTERERQRKREIKNIAWLVFTG